MTELVLGVDLGTTATKVVAVDRAFAVVDTVETGYALHTGPHGEAEQDPAEVLAAAREAVGTATERARARGDEVLGLSFSAALHTLLALDDSGRPLTRALSWGDTRAAETAARIRTETQGALHRATGTPVHPMSPLVKLAWFAEHEPELHARARHWCGLKDYVLADFTGRLVTDLSVASATGLLDLNTRDWHAGALRVAGIGPDQLPELVEPTAVLELAEPVGGLPNGLPVIAGAGDGPLANLAVGAVTPGTAALSVGTSGALRVAHTEPVVDEQCALFCYLLAEDLWVLGGAISNGGVVAAWAADLFGPAPLGTLLTEAAEVPPGARGVLAVPHLLGERAPWWDAAGHGALLGLRRDHRRADVVRALVEGVGHQLAMVRDAVLAADVDITEVRATGGAFRGPLWAEVLAAVLGVELHIGSDRSGSGFGAALLAWRALGGLDSLSRAAELAGHERTIIPDPVATQWMADAHPKVIDIFRVVRDLTG
ncbi:MAG TPA: gluconokinase [Pseudonocardiaceae bacterium]|jgi:gluconokinase|nr:gluconokinase [Pseudonocardiaceae bacterium]